MIKKYKPMSRSENMSRIKSKDTSIEIKLRKELFKKGFRYRKNCKDIYGKPDICFKGKKIAIFCDSEFWHGKNFYNGKDG
ncbi:MAG: mismatch endonuclease, patch repair protein, partial [Campylobacterota bacterium]|nr:mismatch endonuclease, patch repair protein [Campylobacterota bacterium]